MKSLIFSLCVALAAQDVLGSGYPNFSEYLSKVLDAQPDNQAFGMLKKKVDMLTKATCYLGMKYGDIIDEMVSTSSDWDHIHAGRFARLDNQMINGVQTGAWSAKHNRVDEWIQIDLGKPTSISGIITQGRPKAYTQWVTKYKVKCGMEASILADVDGGKDFIGNKDMDSHVHNMFSKTVVCRYVRIYPTAWHDHISMRLELVKGGCGKI